MPFTKDNYPNSMKNLTEEVRIKAIEITNTLLDDGYGESAAIAIGIKTAEEWAKNRDKPVKEDKQQNN